MFKVNTDNFTYLKKDQNLYNLLYGSFKRFGKVHCKISYIDNIAKIEKSDKSDNFFKEFIKEICEYRYNNEYCYFSRKNFKEILSLINEINFNENIMSEINKNIIDKLDQLILIKGSWEIRKIEFRSDLIFDSFKDIKMYY